MPSLLPVSSFCIWLFCFATQALICSTVSERKFLSSVSEQQNWQATSCLACVFACAPLSITATSFCNYTLHCTQTRHQVGPEPTSTAPPALITVAFWKNPSHARVPGQQEALCIFEVPQARGPISRLGLQTLNFILYHQKVSSPHWFTIWAFMAHLMVWQSSEALHQHCIACRMSGRQESVRRLKEEYLGRKAHVLADTETSKGELLDVFFFCVSGRRHVFLSSDISRVTLK